VFPRDTRIFRGTRPPPCPRPRAISANLRPRMRLWRSASPAFRGRALRTKRPGPASKKAPQESSGSAYKKLPPKRVSVESSRPAKRQPPQHITQLPPVKTRSSGEQSCRPSMKARRTKNAPLCPAKKSPGVLLFSGRHQVFLDHRQSILRNRMAAGLVACAQRFLSNMSRAGRSTRARQPGASPVAERHGPLQPTVR